MPAFDLIGPTHIAVASLAALRDSEPEIVRRFASDPTAARMFALDPIRALADMRVVLSPRAIEEWQAVAPALKQHQGVRHAKLYELIKARPPQDGLVVTIRGLLPPIGVSADTADAELGAGASKDQR